MAQDAYSSVPTVAPTTNPGSDNLSVRADPSQTGAQVGQAIQGAGQAGEKLESSVLDIGFHQQGMINEAAATDGETALLAAHGQIVGKYKSLEGLAAVSAAPQAIDDIKSATASIAATMPNDVARRAFTTLALHHEGYAFNDINSYAATSIKQADTISAKSALDVAASRPGDYSIASNPARFNDSVQTIDFQMARIMTNMGYGSGAGTGMKQNPDGTLAFDETTPAGKQAAAIYANTRNQAVGLAWENRIHALADDPQSGNINAAMAAYNEGGDKIPPEARLKLGAWLQPKARSAQVAAASNDALANIDTSYYQDVIAKGGAQSPAAVTQLFLGQESGNRDNIPNSVDHAVGPGQIQPATFAAFAKPGEVITNPADNRAVSQRIIESYMQKYNGDLGRVATAYFSGPSNVAPAGSATPYIRDAHDGNGKAVSSYVSDIEARAGAAPSANAQPTGSYMSKADYIRANYTTLLANADASAAQSHPDDPAYQQMIHARVEQKLNDTIRQQELSYKADDDLAYKAASGVLTKGQIPTSMDAMRAISPEVAASLDNMAQHNPTAFTNLYTKVASANSRGAALGYGSEFYSLYQHVMAPTGEPTRLTDASKLYGLIHPEAGENSPLTNTGLAVLKGLIEKRGTPEGDALATAERNFFQQIRPQLTGSNPATRVSDPNGDVRFNKFMVAALARIDGDLKAGVAPAELFNPKSSGYVGKLATIFQRSPKQALADMAAASSTIPLNFGAAGGQAAVDLTTPDGLRAAVAAGRITKDNAVQIGVKNGWIAPPPPIVPLRH